MDTKRLKEKYGSRLCFRGGIDSSWVLPRGGVADVERELARRIDELGPGGYVLTSVHDVQTDVPGINVAAMFRAGRGHRARGGGS
jgi:uroporphyrinogen decarboxylase